MVCGAREICYSGRLPRDSCNPGAPSPLSAERRNRRMWGAWPRRQCRSSRDATGHLALEALGAAATAAAFAAARSRRPFGTRLGNFGNGEVGLLDEAPGHGPTARNDANAEVAKTSHHLGDALGSSFIRDVGSVKAVVGLRRLDILRIGILTGVVVADLGMRCRVRQASVLRTSCEGCASACAVLHQRRRTSASSWHREGT
mmetsp:Transcript_39843/g.85017  ORF Transcript_39843/g.85017 Transcript_39843/m.85017 type:complete len:201 (+) Transcript_39843:13-615(+)